MTYNAIQSIINRLVGERRVVRFHPDFIDPDEAESREIVLIPSVNDWLHQKDSQRSIEYKENIREHLARFILGGYVDNRDYLKSWKSDIWEIRAQLRRRTDSTRIFGGFLYPNIFVCTNHHMRSKFKNEKAWDRAIDRAIERWFELFPDRKPLKSRPFQNCVTFNAYDHDLGENIPR